MTDSRRGAWDGLLLGGLAVALFWFVAPCTLHDETLAVLARPGAPSPAGSTHLAAVLRWLVATAGDFGVGPHAAGRWFSAICTGLALVLVHAGARRLGVLRLQALFGSAFVLSCPAVVMAATTIHVHAGNLLLASFAFWAATAWATRGSWWLATATGAVAGLAHAAAPVGALLLSAVLPIVWLAQPRWDLRIVLVLAGQSLLALGVQLGIAALLLRGALLTGLPSFAEMGAYDVDTLLPLFLRDAMRSFLPISAIVAVALFHRRWHADALLLAAAVVPHLLVTCHATATLGDDGMLLLAIAPPAALLTARLLTTRHALFALLLALGLSGAKLALRSDWGLCAEFVGGVREATGTTPFTLVSGPRSDEAFLLAALPDVEALRVLVACAPDAPAPRTLTAELLRRQRAGQRVFVTEQAEAALRDPVFRARHGPAPTLLTLLEEQFEWRPIAVRGFVGKELVAR